MSVMPCLVSVEFRRVQAFLFEVPRLRDMVGANVLLGEVLRVELPALASGATWAPSEAVCALLPERAAADPLPAEEHEGLPLADDPRALYRRGILSRDGGHLRLLFPDEAAAQAYAEQAVVLLRQRLPGLRADIRVTPFPIPPNAAAPLSSRPQALPDLPVFHVCEDSGRQPANAVEPVSGRRLAASSLARKERARAFAEGRSWDIVGLLRRAGLARATPPNDLQGLCDGDYLALIHADGNAIGAAYAEAAGAVASDLAGALAREARGEAFFHAMRLTFRQATVAALNETFAEAPGGYQLLMLGGDDLLLACRARLALPFAVAYARALEDLGAGRYSAGLGVAVADPRFPIHRLHAMAEALAASAKRLYRGLAPARPASVVDWRVCSEAIADDLAAQRRAWAMRRYSGSEGAETLALSARPYPVLGEDGLEGLLRAAQGLAWGEGPDAARAARSQLRRLEGELARGRLAGELAFRELPAATRTALAAVGVTTPWQAVAGPDGAPRRWRSRLPDLVEVHELLRHLGHPNPGPAEEVNHAS